jgi:phosphohistidine phosphatase
MKLYLMRHGEAAATDKNTEQELTSDGKKGIERLATHLQGKQLLLGQVYHSGKKRAQQTSEIIAGRIAPGLRTSFIENIKPGDAPSLLLAKLENWTEDCLVVSHLPFVPRLVSLMTKTDEHLETINYEPGTFICLEKNPRGDWELAWTTSPSKVLNG